MQKIDEKSRKTVEKNVKVDSKYIEKIVRNIKNHEKLLKIERKLT